LRLSPRFSQFPSVHAHKNCPISDRFGLISFSISIKYISLSLFA
jgi:hypothetical protein